jgi:hypothetical protein
MKPLTTMFVFALSFLLLGATCDPPPVVIVPPDTDKCPAACANLQVLGCEEGDPLGDGTTCTEFCIRTQKNGAWLDPDCVSKVQSCHEIEKTCAQKRPVIIPGEKGTPTE